MKPKGSGYIPISITSLRVGMQINYSIYHKKNSNYILLCKDVVLTLDLIKKFKQITYPERNIYIPNNRLKEILDFGVVRNKFKYKGYNVATTETSALLDTVSVNGKVTQEVATVVTDTIYTQLETVEVSKIISSINSVRRVDEYLHTHSVNVALLNGLLGRWMNYDVDNLNKLVKIGLLHDIGKLKVPKEILNKPGRLTEDEFDIIKKHPVFSVEILIDSKVDDVDILNGVVQHHEKTNGSGYPYGLNLDDITDFARITSVSDVYDAMVAKRAYKEAHSPFEILSWFSKGRYSELDIAYVNIFIDAMLNELTGKEILLSNNQVAEVVYIDKADFEFPLVKVGNKIIPTSKDLYCVSLISE